MTKSELIEALARRQKHLACQRRRARRQEHCSSRSARRSSTGERIEIRGFGSFSLHFRPPRMGRNPKTGDSVALPGKHVPHFKPGKELRERVNDGVQPTATRIATRSATSALLRAAHSAPSCRAVVIGWHRRSDALTSYRDRLQTLACAWPDRSSFWCSSSSARCSVR